MENDETTAPNDTAALEAARAELAAAAEAVLAGVPEHLKALIPTALPPADRIKWYTAAKASGAFDKPPVPITDGDKRPTVTPKQPDPTSLPAYARMAAGYRK